MGRGLVSLSDPISHCAICLYSMHALLHNNRDNYASSCARLGGIGGRWGEEWGGIW